MELSTEVDAKRKAKSFRCWICFGFLAEKFSFKFTTYNKVNNENEWLLSYNIKMKSFRYTYFPQRRLLEGTDYFDAGFRWHTEF